MTWDEEDLWAWLLISYMECFLTNDVVWMALEVEWSGPEWKGWLGGILYGIMDLLYSPIAFL